jgi:hypothetical protein
MTMKQQIELEMRRAEKIKNIRLDFQREMRELDRKDAERAKEEEKLQNVGLLGGN